MFNQQKFDYLLQSESLTYEQTMFCLKILVWQHTNWQTDTILDLNLSFFGGQFRSLINDRPLTEEPTQESICCDYETFEVLSQQKLYTDRVPVLWNAHRLEQWLSEGAGVRLSWNQALYLLKSIYNPETGFGRLDLRPGVIEALAATDLFFGLVNLMISRHFKSEPYLTYARLSGNDFVFTKIKTAAENFSAKVEALASRGNFEELFKFARSLQDFFGSQSERIKWIEATETNCVFLDRPLHVASILQSILKPYPAPAVVENIPDKQLLNYFLQRLGLITNDISNAQNGVLKDKIVQCVIQSYPAAEKEILNLLTPANLPAMVIFSDKTTVRDFYDRNYINLKKFSNVFAQSYSGGSNKILRNFGIRPASVLLATPAFIIRGHQQLEVRTLVIIGLPKLETDHPYLQALNDHWQDKFPNFLELQIILRLYLLLQAVGKPMLERIQIFPAEQEPFSLKNIALSLGQLPFLDI